MTYDKELKLNSQFREISDMAITIAQDRRILIDFLYTASASKNSKGKYTHSREELSEKAGKLLKDLGL